MNSAFDLSGRTAFLSGATGHLGREIARALMQAGATVLINGRNLSACEALAEDLRAGGGSATAASFDVTSEEAVAEFFDKLDGPLHVLINNAYAGGSGSVQTAPVSRYREAYEITVVSAHMLLQAALPNLRLAAEQDGGASVINVASMYGLVSPDLRVYDSLENANPPFYGAAKGALIQFTRYAACEFGSQGIRVNAIAPGPFPADAVHASAPEFVQKLAQKSPMGRVGVAREIGGPIVFLASSAASYVNGAVVPVDGGWTSW